MKIVGSVVYLPTIQKGMEKKIKNRDLACAFGFIAAPPLELSCRRSVHEPSSDTC